LLEGQSPAESGVLRLAASDAPKYLSGLGPHGLARGVSAGIGVFFMKSQSKATAKIPSTQSPTYLKALNHLNKGEVEAALQLCANNGGEPALTNLQGVCLLRLGKYEQAASLFRGLVVQPGAGWLNANTPTHHKVNFALAQFLSGRFQAGAELLTETNDETHPAIIRVRQCLRRWEKSLTIWQWINWKLGGSHPEGARLPLDFQLGVLEEGVIREIEAAPTSTASSVSKLVNS